MQFLNLLNTQDNEIQIKKTEGEEILVLVRCSWVGSAISGQTVLNAA